MNFTELKTEFFARGTDYLEEDAESIARAERWLNQAYREIANLHVWPFLITELSGSTDAGFVNPPDLRRILWVAEVTTSGMRPLRRVTEAELRTHDGVWDLAETGTPDQYYLTSDGIYAYPLGGTIRVQYVKRLAPLTGTDTPVFDEEYHNLIIDKAMIRAYVDNDNFEAAAALREEYNLGMQQMAEDYLIVSRELSYIQVDPYDG